MAWTGLLLTVDGRNALNQAQVNNRLNIKSIVVGDGKAPANYSTQKNLVHQLYELTDINIEKTEKECILTADFPKVDYDYYFREIGVIVTTDDGDKLYVYDNCGDEAQLIISSDVEATEKRLRLYITISDVAEITITAPSIMYVDYDTYERDKELAKTSDTKDNIVTFTSSDSEAAEEWTDVPELESGENHARILAKISTMFKNIRYLYKMLGTTDISKIDDGTITKILSTLNSEKHSHPNKKVLDNTTASYTEEEKTKLNGIASGANAYTLPVARSSELGGIKSGTDIDVDNYGNVSVKDDSHNHVISNVDGLQEALGYKLETSLKGTANGLAELDSSGKVPSSQLPSYVDDVVEGYFYNSKFYEDSGHTKEIASESGKIYIDLSTNKTYRWSGSAFVVVSETLALGETSSSAYRGDRGKTAYEHSQTSGNPHGVTKSDVGLGNVPNVSTNDQTPTFTVASSRTNIASGDKLSVILSKIMKFFTDLKSVAFSGSYNDLSNKPTIPTVGNGTITIKQAGTSKGTFTMNQSGNTTIELTDNNTTYSNMAAATSSAAGKAGLVPAPAAGAQTKFLRGDGTWQTPTDTNTDTKNTAGTTNKTGTKMFLAGATSQAANPVTYSNSNCYIGTDNELYSGGKKVAHQADIDKLNSNLVITNEGTTQHLSLANYEMRTVNISVDVPSGKQIALAIPWAANDNCVVSVKSVNANTVSIVVKNFANSYVDCFVNVRCLFDE